MLKGLQYGLVGLFMGAWGMASAISRLSGNLISGIIRDRVSAVTLDDALGYMVVFGLEILMLVLSLWILRQVDVSAFHQKAQASVAYAERAAIAGEGG